MAHAVFLPSERELTSDAHAIGVTLAPLLARRLTREARNLETSGVVVVALDGHGLP